MLCTQYTSSVDQQKPKFYERIQEGYMHNSKDKKEGSYVSSYATIEWIYSLN